VTEFEDFIGMAEMPGISVMFVISVISGMAEENDTYSTDPRFGYRQLQVYHFMLLQLQTWHDCPK
jgi:hypothetical protein